MNTYRLTNDLIYREVPESVGSPFLLTGSFNRLLTPWAVTLVEVEFGLLTGATYAAVLYRERHKALQFGEFFVPDLMVDNYWFEVKRDHERRVAAQP